MGKYPRKLGRKTWQMFHRPVGIELWVAWDLLGCGGRKVVKRDQLKWKFQFRKVFVVCFEAWLSFFSMAICWDLDGNWVIGTLMQDWANVLSRMICGWHNFCTKILS